MQTKAILFDMDGVILDSEKVYRRFWLQAAEELGRPLKEDVVLQLRSCDSSIARKIVDEAAGESGAYDRIRARRKILMKEFLSEHTYELKPGECLAIEDSPNGVRSAYGAGVKVVMVPDLTGPTDELRRMCRVADRIEEVMEYL